MPLCSVIIPTYNRKQLVTRAITSLVNQKMDNFEVIVVDDGSTDGTVEELQQIFRDEPVQFILQKQQGATVARNLGASKATGEWLIFLDSDDELLPDGLKYFAAGFESDNVGVVCSSAKVVNSDGEQIRINLPRNLGAAYENYRGLFLAGTFAVQRAVFNAVGQFAAECRSSQHTEFSLRLLPYCYQHQLNVKCIEELTLRIHDHAEGHLRNNMQTLLDGALYIIKQHEQQLRKSPKHYADWCTVAAVYAAKLQQYPLTRQLLWDAVKTCRKKRINFARLLVAYFPALAKFVWQNQGEVNQSI